MFSAVEAILLMWPHQVLDPLKQSVVPLRAAGLIRRQEWRLAESELLAALARDQDDSAEISWLLSYLYLLSGDFGKARAWCDWMRQRDHGQCPFWYIDLLATIGSTQGRRSSAEVRAIHLLIDQAMSDRRQGRFVLLGRIFCKVFVEEYDQAGKLIENFPAPDCLELQRLRVDLVIATGQRDIAIDLLKSLLRKAPHSKGLLVQYSEACARLQLSSEYVPVLRQAVAVLGEHPLLLSMITQVKLLMNEPALALRSMLMHQAWLSLSKSGYRSHLTNKIAAYELNGRAPWLKHLVLPTLNYGGDRDRALASNLVFQFASVESPRSAEMAQGLMQFYEPRKVLPPFRPSKTRFQSPLRLAWITADVTPHPVSRFLLSFLANVDQSSGEQHILVDVSGHYRSYAHGLIDQFRSLPCVDLLDLHRTNYDTRVAQIRELSVDVAVDLTGWTGGEFQEVLFNRVAPVQVNYLGYFASTGNPSVDAWVGDEALFPDPMQEWHTEQIVRLKRPFLAWQPHSFFPEAELPITDAPAHHEFRFGCFNANRKISDQTLRVWARIFQQLPQARLVLKANQSSDPSTQVLLRRRMHRQGLNPEQVIWLPRADSHAEHLQQYALMDVALDCFPNGGCTTTCEALWMGVPVIALTGHSYVSRMSTAVLNGAGLAEWCALTEDDYVGLALRWASQRQWLRANRQHWRSQVQQSLLGDAAGLMRSLSESFCNLRDQAAAV